MTARRPRRSLARMCSQRGATEVGIALVAALLVAGVTFGVGLTRTALSSSDGLTWLGDDTRGEAVQVNPATGRAETRLIVAPPGNSLALAQRDGLLVITDTGTGLVSLIDVATLATAGRYRATGAGATTVLLDEHHLYVADRAGGSIVRLDPATATPVGTPWTAGLPLADAALDAGGTVWALTITGGLHQLAWSDDAVTLVASAPARSITGAGPDSVLVAHERGVTVFAPEAELIARAGTGTDTTLPAPGLAAPLAAPATSPLQLTPAALTEDGVILLVTDGQLHQVPVSKVGCHHPGRPEVYTGRVYVPCDGAHKVIVLTPDGSHLHDITVPDGANPMLVVNDGHLFINVPGATTGILIDTNGAPTTIEVHNERAPVKDPNDMQEIIVPPLPNPGSGNNNGGGGGGNTGPDEPSQPTPGPPTGQRLTPPTGVTAIATPDGRATVTWQPTSPADRYDIIRDDTGEIAGSAPANATTATITTVPLGTTTAYRVRAIRATQPPATSSPSNLVTHARAPDPPTNVQTSLAADNGTSLTLAITWSQGADGGTPLTEHTISATAANPITVSGAATSAQIAVPCSGPCWNINVTVTVTAHNTVGSTTANDTYTHISSPASPPPPGPSDGDTVITGATTVSVCIPKPSICRTTVYDYTLLFSFPQAWRDFGGTCILRDSTGGNPDRSISCATTSADIGSGDGRQHTFTVRACDGSCVTSKSYAITTLPPEPVCEVTCL